MSETETTTNKIFEPFIKPDGSLGYHDLKKKIFSGNIHDELFLIGSSLFLIIETSAEEKKLLLQIIKSDEETSGISFSAAVARYKIPRNTVVHWRDKEKKNMFFHEKSGRPSISVLNQMKTVDETKKVKLSIALPWMTGLPSKRVSSSTSTSSVSTTGGDEAMSGRAQIGEDDSNSEDDSDSESNIIDSLNIDFPAHQTLVETFESTKTVDRETANPARIDDEDTQSQPTSKSDSGAVHGQAEAPRQPSLQRGDAKKRKVTDGA